jgi:hypothetical protein
MTFSSTKDTILKRIKDFILVPPAPGESLFQFIIRQFLLPDSSGNPSITITISSIITAMSMYVVAISSKIAMTPIKKYDPITGKLIMVALQGYPAEFWYFLITMFTAVTYLYKQRQDAKSPIDSGDLDTNTILTKAVEIINKIKTK